MKTIKTKSKNIKNEKEKKKIVEKYLSAPNFSARLDMLSFLFHNKKKYTWIKKSIKRISQIQEIYWKSSYIKKLKINQMVQYENES